jgi:hypothetical protein
MSSETTAELEAQVQEWLRSDRVGVHRVMSRVKPLTST